MNNLRQRVSAKIEANSLGLRAVEVQSGVSFATVSRFLRGEEITVRNIEKFEAWLSNKPLPKQRVVATKKVSVGNKHFLITIEALS